MKNSDEILIQFKSWLEHLVIESNGPPGNGHPYYIQCLDKLNELVQKATEKYEMEQQVEPPEITKKYDSLNSELYNTVAEIETLNERIASEENHLKEMLELEIRCKESGTNLHYASTQLSKIDTKLLNMSTELENAMNTKIKLENAFENVEQEVRDSGWYKQRSTLLTPAIWKKHNESEIKT